MTYKCPCCGSLTDATPKAADLAHLQLPIVLRTMLNKLVRNHPNGVGGDEMIAELYRGSREPEYARVAVSVQMRNLRRIINDSGWTIPTSRPGRGNKSVYRLVPLPPASRMTNDTDGRSFDNRAE